MTLTCKPAPASILYIRIALTTHPPQPNPPPERGRGAPSTHGLGESGELLSLCPAEDVEAVEEGAEQQKVWDEEGGQDVLLTAHMVERLIVGVGGGSNADLQRWRERGGDILIVYNTSHRAT